MASVLKKRKIIDGPASRRMYGGSIGAYGRISKSGLPQSSKKELTVPTKIALDSDSEREHKVVCRNAKPTESKKRTRADEDEDSKNSDKPLANLGEASAKASARSTAAASRKKARVAPKGKTVESPSQSSRAFFAAFVKPASDAQRPSQASPDGLLAPSKTQAQLDDDSQELVDLHTAFINALALHYAHNGTASPVEIRALIPSIEKRWGKRRIGSEDVQRILGIQQWEADPAQGSCVLSLVEYSRSKVCIEYRSASVAFPIDSLKNDFLAAIKKIKVQGKTAPLAPIRPFKVLEEGALSKGARRLQEIKAAAIDAQTSKKPAPAAAVVQEPAASKPASRATSLLDRIRNKEAHAAAAPAAPSPDFLARRAALMRLEEIIPVLEILSGSSSSSIASRNLYSSSASSASLASLASLSSLGTSLGLGPIPPAKVVSFTMSTVVQHLQNSLKHPIAREEAERCVRLLATDVSPRWVGIREVGKVTGITFRGKVGRAEWMGRLKELLEAR